MITTTLDPISLNDVIDTETAPYLVEQDGDTVLKIYFETEANRARYQDARADSQPWQFEKLRQAG